MKFVHVEDYFDPNAGYQINELISADRPSDVELFLITSYDMSPFHKNYDKKIDDEYEKKYNIRIIRLKHLFKFSSRILFINLQSTIKKISPDIVYFHGIGDFKDLLLFKKVKYITYRDCHMSWVASKNMFAPLYFRIYRFLFSKRINNSERYKKIFYLGVEEKEYLLKLGISNNKLFPLLHGFNSDKLHYSIDDRIKLRNEWDIDTSSILIGYVGKFDEYKCPHLVFSIVRKISIENMHKIRLVFIGSKDNKYMRYFNNELISFQNDHKFPILVLDSVPFLEIYKVYSAIDICIFPKQTTLSSIHAQVCGCEVVMEKEKSNIERVQKSRNLFEKDDIVGAGMIIDNLLNNWNGNRSVDNIKFFKERDYKMQAYHLYKLK